MFPCEPDSKKHQAAKDLSVPASFRVPRCFLIGEKQECSSVTELRPVALISTGVVVFFSKRDIGRSLTHVCKISGCVINMNGHLNTAAGELSFVFFLINYVIVCVNSYADFIA